MKIKLDENIPAGLVVILNKLGYPTDTVLDEGLQGSNDGDVWAAAQQSGRFLITQDLDFSDIRRFQPGTHHGLLLLRLRDPGRHALFRRIQTLFLSEDLNHWKNCFVVVTEHKIRVRRPK